MPDNSGAVTRRGAQTCDLCHARKIKCNRKDPCLNCINTKSPCARTRKKRPNPPKKRVDDKLQALSQRLANLEDSVRSTVAGRDSTSQASNKCPVELSMKVIGASDSSNIMLDNTHCDMEPIHQPAHEAQVLIKEELSPWKLFSLHQRSVLEQALSLVDHLSNCPVPAMRAHSILDACMHVPIEITPSEIIHVIIGTEARDASSSHVHFQSLDHIPPKAVERIALALMEDTADENTRNLYKVVVHFKAAVVLYASQLQTPKCPAVQKHIQRMEQRHLSAALTALGRVGFLNNPSLLLVQALLAGALVMQIVGHPTTCWELVARASGMIVALGYHEISESGVDDGYDEEVLAVLAWCSHLDSCMSLLLLRPRSLPPMDIDVSSLVPSNPSNPMALFDSVEFKMVPVHNKILDITMGRSGQASHCLIEEVTRLRACMTDIFRLMQKECPSSLLRVREDILLHWKCLEFKYFSTLTAVHRLSPAITTDLTERQQCLQSARDALECLTVIVATSDNLGHFPDGYNPYLSWTMLSYPLCPYFVVFCNVVDTSNKFDYALLQTVTEGISDHIENNENFYRLHRLFSTLLSLCSPLVQMLDPHERNYSTAATPAYTEKVSTVQPPLDSGDIPTYSDYETCSATGDRAVPTFTSNWNDDMILQLFQSQPSLDWFNADILNPTWDSVMQSDSM